MDTNRFSFFKAPISNTKPSKTVSLVEVYNYIRGNDALERTNFLRTIADKKQAQKYKGCQFDYCTFSGVFSERTDKLLSNIQICSALILMGYIRMNVRRLETKNVSCP